MAWIQLLIDINKTHLETVEEQLLALGAVSISLQEHIPAGAVEQPILEPGLNETPLWATTQVTGLFDANCDTESITQTLQHCLQQHAPQSTQHLRWQTLADKNWEREWMQNYHPIQVSPTLWICPSWKSAPDPQATTVLLDPGLAFGTGTHPTTFLCMQWLSEQRLQQQTLIDYGCGSGILAITALLLGAEQVIAIDIDPQALTATEANLRRNRLNPDKLSLSLPGQDRAQAPLLIANILAGPLAELADTLIDKLLPNGQLCLSGILAEQAEQVMAAYQHRIIFDTPRQQEQWLCLSGRKV
ncbi:MAG: 50S ribosomal protein L11 methyltransferase [Cellvibrionaceae bacterium]|nr:50S ribosomal protein L11 methyltransferase [Cellvibrionaceae bacterium]